MLAELTTQRERDYLLGTCSVLNCALCRMAKELRRPGMKHAGLTGLDIARRADAPQTPLDTRPSRRANDRQVDGDHYKTQEIQPWDYIVANGLDFLEGNVVKYVTRHRKKNGLADLEKAKHYLEKLIETEKARIGQLKGSA